MSVELVVEPLAPSVGVEVDGLDITASLASETVSRLRRLLAEHHLLLMRNVDLSPEAQARFARYFGDTSQRELNKEAVAGSDNQYVSNVRADGIFGKGELDFHIDQLFLEEPLKALILYAVEIPEAGGGTKFLNTEAVYDALPTALQTRLLGLRCRHARAYDKETTADWNVVDADQDSPSWVHPLLRENAATGKHAIWVNKLTTIGVEDMPAAESDALIAEVRSHFYNDAYTYSHHWKTGDMIIWDNLVLQHARMPFDPSAARTLRRTAIL